MPLQTLPSQFDDATHRELDATVNETVGNLVEGSNYNYADLLSAIIYHSNGHLDTQYSYLFKTKELISSNPELRDALASAWERKSYSEVRNLAILRAPQPDPKPTSTTTYTPQVQDEHGSLSRSFHAEYSGVAVDGFYEYLTQNEKLFRTVNYPKYYAKFCSIVQSSGTGKSRLLTELSKKNVIVIYMNLRTVDDKDSFPARDRILSRILTKFPDTRTGYRTVCYAFFIALFDTIEEHLSQSYTTRSTNAEIMNWARQMCDMSDPPKSTVRADFFKGLSVKYDMAYADLVRGPNRLLGATANNSPSLDFDKMADSATGADIEKKMSDLSISETDEDEEDPLPSHYISSLFDAYGKMVDSLLGVFPDHSDHPKLVIAVDEAHPLTEVQKTGYRPADVFCRVVNRYSHRGNYAIWVVFASTTSKVADFAPPNKKHNSARVATFGQKLFSPYTQLGWDQKASPLGEVDIEHVSRVRHIADYGRPLWFSLKSALRDPNSVLDTAKFKLCGADDFNAEKRGHALAVLGQRFGLKVTFGHPDSVEHLEDGVASHLLVCLGTTLDRNWRFTIYPSEPLLSCAAAINLHKQPDNLANVLKTLLGAVNSGMIDMGQRGELASRLLWLLAKDLFVRKRKKNVDSDIRLTWDKHLADCEMIPVVDWLEFIFGPQVWDQKDTQAPLARNMFKNAYLNFSHWICMEANIAGSTDRNELGLDEWTLRHWYRTSAVQCCHQQPLIDKMIPIYFKCGAQSKLMKPQMSQIFVSDKAGKSNDSRDVLRSITRRHRNVGGEGTFESLPYIAILADLGQPSSFSITFPERSVDDRCLRIYAAGVESSTYPFLAGCPALRDTLRNLVYIQQIPATQRPFAEYLDAQVKFGSTTAPEHMVWERAKDVPDVWQEPTRQS